MDWIHRHCRRPARPSLGPWPAKSRTHLQTGYVPSHRPVEGYFNQLKSPESDSKKSLSETYGARELLVELTLNSTSICQFETVRGIRLHSQPVCEGLSWVNRICRFVFCIQYHE